MANKSAKLRATPPFIVYYMQTKTQEKEPDELTQKSYPIRVDQNSWVKPQQQNTSQNLNDQNYQKNQDNTKQSQKSYMQNTKYYQNREQGQDFSTPWIRQDQQSKKLQGFTQSQRSDTLNKQDYPSLGQDQISRDKLDTQMQLNQNQYKPQYYRLLQGSNQDRSSKLDTYNFSSQRNFGEEERPPWDDSYQEGLSTKTQAFQNSSQRYTPNKQNQTSNQEQSFSSYDQQRQNFGQQSRPEYTDYLDTNYSKNQGFFRNNNKKFLTTPLPQSFGQQTSILRPPPPPRRQTIQQNQSNENLQQQQQVPQDVNQQQNIPQYSQNYQFQESTGERQSNWNDNLNEEQTQQLPQSYEDQKVPNVYSNSQSQSNIPNFQPLQYPNNQYNNTYTPEQVVNVTPSANLQPEYNQFNQEADQSDYESSHESVFDQVKDDYESQGITQTSGFINSSPQNLQGMDVYNEDNSTYNQGYTSPYTRNLQPEAGRRSNRTSYYNPRIPQNEQSFENSQGYFSHVHLSPGSTLQSQKQTPQKSPQPLYQDSDRHQGTSKELQTDVNQQAGIEQATTSDNSISDGDRSNIVNKQIKDEAASEAKRALEGVDLVDPYSKQRQQVYGNKDSQGLQTKANYGASQQQQPQTVPSKYNNRSYYKYNKYEQPQQGSKSYNDQYYNNYYQNYQGYYPSYYGGYKNGQYGRGGRYQRGQYNTNKLYPRGQTGYMNKGYRRVPVSIAQQPQMTAKKEEQSPNSNTQGTKMINHDTVVDVQDYPKPSQAISYQAQTNNVENQLPQPNQKKQANLGAAPEQNAWSKPLNAILKSKSEQGNIQTPLAQIQQQQAQTTNTEQTPVSQNQSSKVQQETNTNTDTEAQNTIQQPQPTQVNQGIQDKKPYDIQQNTQSKQVQYNNYYRYQYNKYPGKYVRGYGYYGQTPYSSYRAGSYNYSYPQRYTRYPIRRTTKIVPYVNPKQNLQATNEPVSAQQDDVAGSVSTSEPAAATSQAEASVAQAIKPLVSQDDQSHLQQQKPQLVQSQQYQSQQQQQQQDQPKVINQVQKQIIADEKQGGQEPEKVVVVNVQGPTGRGYVYRGGRGRGRGIGLGRGSGRGRSKTRAPYQNTSYPSWYTYPRTQGISGTGDKSSLKASANLNYQDTGSTNVTIKPNFQQTTKSGATVYPKAGVQQSTLSRGINVASSRNGISGEYPQRFQDPQLLGKGGKQQGPYMGTRGGQFGRGRSRGRGNRSLGYSPGINKSRAQEQQPIFNANLQQKKDQNVSQKENLTQLQNAFKQRPWSSPSAYVQGQNVVGKQQNVQNEVSNQGEADQQFNFMEYRTSLDTLQEDQQQESIQMSKSLDALLSGIPQPQGYNNVQQNQYTNANEQLTDSEKQQKLFDQLPSNFDQLNLQLDQAMTQGQGGQGEGKEDKGRLQYGSDTTYNQGGFNQNMYNQRDNFGTYLSASKPQPNVNQLNVSQPEKQAFKPDEKSSQTISQQGNLYSLPSQVSQNPPYTYSQGMFMLPYQNQGLQNQSYFFPQQPSMTSYPLQQLEQVSNNQGDQQKGGQPSMDQVWQIQAPSTSNSNQYFSTQQQMPQSQTQAQGQGSQTQQLQRPLATGDQQVQNFHQLRQEQIPLNKSQALYSQFQGQGIQKNNPLQMQPLIQGLSMQFLNPQQNMMPSINFPIAQQQIEFMPNAMNVSGSSQQLEVSSGEGDVTQQEFGRTGRGTGRGAQGRGRYRNTQYRKGPIQKQYSDMISKLPEDIEPGTMNPTAQSNVQGQEYSFPGDLQTAKTTEQGVHQGSVGSQKYSSDGSYRKRGVQQFVEPYSAQNYYQKNDKQAYLLQGNGNNQPYYAATNANDYRPSYGRGRFSSQQYQNANSYNMLNKPNGYQGHDYDQVQNQLQYSSNNESLGSQQGSNNQKSGQNMIQQDPHQKINQNYPSYRFGGRAGQRGRPRGGRYNQQHQRKFTR